MVLYDRELIDDELFSLWAECKPGVRIALFSDSCHSGSVARAVREAVGPERMFAHVDATSPEPRMKGLPWEKAKEVYRKHQDLYDGIQESTPATEKSELQSRVILISGCQDSQTSLDGDENGLFTQNLLEVWNGGEFAGSYPTFHKQIALNMPPWQAPNFFTYGAIDNTFEQGRPFTI